VVRNYESNDSRGKKSIFGIDTPLARPRRSIWAKNDREPEAPPPVNEQLKVAISSMEPSMGGGFTGSL
jgi:hypothetical protein